MSWASEQLNRLRGVLIRNEGWSAGGALYIAGLFIGNLIIGANLRQGRHGDQASIIS